jgi:hypothetical protein
MRSDFGLGKFADAAPEPLLFVSEGEIHGSLRISNDAKRRTIYLADFARLEPSKYASCHESLIASAAQAASFFCSNQKRQA